MKRILTWLAWMAVVVAGVFAYAAIALRRGETLNSGYLVIAAACTYAIGYRFYSKWIAAKVLALDARRSTPCEVHDDGKDFVKTNKWIVFGHHFAAISGPGPLVGPVLAAQFGYLPGTLWILIGAVLGGAVQDFVILFCSIRRDGKSLGQMVRDELNSTAGAIALVGILAIMTILLAVLALVVVNALAESPWGVFTVGATIPIAMFMGGYLRFLRAGRVLEVSVVGVVLLLLAVWGGQFVYASPRWSAVFQLGKEPIAWSILVYGFAASVLPVWLLLAPRDYLSTFMKLGTILALAVGVLVVLPDLQMPALSKFVDGSGLVVPGKLFPFCFITIACGAISGFHSLISSGITPKIITREPYARPVGYGAMCLESLVAIMAMIAACTLDPATYLGMNVAGTGPDLAARAANIAAKVTAAGFPVSIDAMNELARQMGEPTLFGKTGGAATLAVGMAKIFSGLTHGRWLDLWYHFAIMFEALFILTTLDAGTRVGRYLLQDVLGNVWKPLGDIRSVKANLVASGLIVGGWGYFLIQGVRDPDGGVKALWPLFGIANQLLAAIALCLATTVILKMLLNARLPARTQGEASGAASPWAALVTIVPLAWLLAVTVTAGTQKIFHPSPKIGFIAAAEDFDARLQAIEKDFATKVGTLAAEQQTAARKEMRLLRVQRSNNVIDAAVAGIFLVLVALIVLLSLREWWLLLSGAREPRLHETEPVWLPDYAVVEGKPLRWFGLFALLPVLLKEITGEAQVDRAEQRACVCPCDGAGAVRHASDAAAAVSPDASPESSADRRARIYVEVLEKRYRGINRCC